MYFVFLLLSVKAHTSDTAVIEFVLTPKKIVKQLSAAAMKQTAQLKQIIEIQEEVTMIKNQEVLQSLEKQKVK
ncbi:hypothetical protein [Wolbachia endosymbiont of Litomosoides sigmodontis]|uniref:hypothetical protein n=1 Tax=Wolbachia endosymbiont of Litomosoides sigmodontis TaxID=80850 RepID=UPI001C55081F|nr:hypothetical protein [Wolbachia endosymbiont of Litomosoides sigmodontis]